MPSRNDGRNPQDDRVEGFPSRKAVDTTDLVVPGALFDFYGSRNRIIALIDERVLACNVSTHHNFLVQETDGSIQLPRLTTILAMMDAGQVMPVADASAVPSPTERMRVQIAMLDAAKVAQGEKSIWIFLSTHWTPALAAEFGPHDQPWKIRRWRAALRRAAAARRAKSDDPSID